MFKSLFVFIAVLVSVSSAFATDHVLDLTPASPPIVVATAATPSSTSASVVAAAPTPSPAPSTPKPSFRSTFSLDPMVLDELEGREARKAVCEESRKTGFFEETWTVSHRITAIPPTPTLTPTPTPTPAVHHCPACGQEHCPLKVIDCRKCGGNVHRKDCPHWERYAPGRCPDQRLTTLEGRVSELEKDDVPPPEAPPVVTAPVPVARPMYYQGTPAIVNPIVAPSGLEAPAVVHYDDGYSECIPGAPTRQIVRCGRCHRWIDLNMRHQCYVAERTIAGLGVVGLVAGGFGGYGHHGFGGGYHHGSGGYRTNPGPGTGHSPVIPGPGTGHSPGPGTGH
jgi:hypothetical protein